jgi:hypothetical protein
MRKSLVAASGLDGLLSVIVIAGLNEPRFLSMTPDLTLVGVNALEFTL